MKILRNNYASQNKRTTIYFSPAEREALKKVSHAENISLSGWVRLLVRRELKTLGLAE